MTLFTLSLDLKSGDFSYCSAAHPPAVILGADQTDDSRSWQRALPFSPSSPIGSEKNTEYEEFHGVLKPGDRLLFLTDGLKDLGNPEGKRLNSHGEFYRKILPKASNRFKGASDLQEELLRVIRDFRKDTPLDDDVTFMIFQFNPK